MEFITDVGRSEILGVPVTVLNEQDYPLLMRLAEELARYEAEKQKKSGVVIEGTRAKIIS